MSVVVATKHPASEDREEVIALFEETIAAVHANDAGCELYAMPEDADTLVMIEKCSSAEDLESHRVSETMKSLDPKLAGKLTDKTVVKLTTGCPASNSSTIYGRYPRSCAGDIRFRDEWRLVTRSSTKGPVSMDRRNLCCRTASRIPRAAALVVGCAEAPVARVDDHRSPATAPRTLGRTPRRLARPTLSLSRGTRTGGPGTSVQPADAA